MVAIVIPEMGLELEPIRPTMRLATVTKKKPKTKIKKAKSRRAPTPWTGSEGRQAKIKSMIKEPPKTVKMERSRSVRATFARSAPPRSALKLEVKEETIVGRVLRRVKKPPLATAPAPIWRTLAL